MKNDLYDNDYKRNTDLYLKNRDSGFDTIAINYLDLYQNNI